MTGKSKGPPEKDLYCEPDNSLPTDQPEIDNSLPTDQPEIDNSLPTDQPEIDNSLPPNVDNSLPGDQPGIDNSLPGDQPGIDNSLPPNVDNSLPGDQPGIDNSLPTDQPEIDNSLPPNVDNSLPGDQPGIDNSLPRPERPVDPDYSNPPPGDLIDEIQSAKKIELVFSNGEKEIAITAVVLTGENFKIGLAGVEIRDAEILVHGPGPGAQAFVIEGYALFIDDEQAAYHPRPEPLTVAPGMTINVAPDIVF